MSDLVLGIVVCIGIFLAVVVFLGLGRRVGMRWPLHDDEGGRSGIAAVEGAVFALMGLLLAFSFSGALSRWDLRRQHVTAEVNAIGTAYLRIDLLPAAAQPAIKQRFRDYVDSRLATYADVRDHEATLRDKAKSAAIQTEIWQLCLAACRSVDTPQSTMLLVPALNEMFDMATSRDLAAAAHPPLVVFLMLGAAVLTGSFLAGYDMSASKKSNRFHMLGYAALISFTVYATLDIEFPRVGFVRIDFIDQALIDLKSSMK